MGQRLSEHGLQVSLLIDQAATKRAVLERVASANFLHLACHGTFEPNQPDRSGLVLVPDDQPELLSLRELSALQLSQLKLAVLSACWSADSFILPGRWVITLPETLWRAGAQTILGCLWEVDDQVAKPFMEQFYCHLTRLPPAQALRQVQQACLENRLKDCSKTDTSDPLYWAGFVLFGEASSTQFTTGQRSA
jgi:CHAT domain-containing protein